MLPLKDVILAFRNVFLLLRSLSYLFCMMLLILSQIDLHFSNTFSSLIKMDMHLFLLIFQEIHFFVQVGLLMVLFFTFETFCITIYYLQYFFNLYRLLFLQQRNSVFSILTSSNFKNPFVTFFISRSASLLYRTQEEKNSLTRKRKVFFFYFLSIFVKVSLIWAQK